MNIYYVSFFPPHALSLSHYFSLSFSLSLLFALSLSCLHATLSRTPAHLASYPLAHTCGEWHLKMFQGGSSSPGSVW